jgi:hypothetical protein
LIFNGIDAVSGGYLLSPLRPEEIVKIALAESPEPALVKELQYYTQRSHGFSFGVVESRDPTKLDESGWGVIFAADADSGIREALRPLLELRRAQAGKWKENYYREYAGPAGYRPGESKQEFLARQGAGPGPADPEKMPYYLLLVGDPEAIPFRFQCQLDVQYAVGRLWFEKDRMPDLDAFARYAYGVVAAETGAVTRPSRLTFFGTEHPDDYPTHLSAQGLVRPLADQLEWNTRGARWEVHALVGSDATKAGLTQLLGGEDTPALLFTAGHGVGFPASHPRHRTHQGALLCQDWPGPRSWSRSIPEHFYFAADDVASDARLAGLIAFHYASYSAGSPRLDDSASPSFPRPNEIGPQAFVAGLPQRLLSHPGGAVLAVVGLVDRAWGYSFSWDGAGRELVVFQSMLRRLLEGEPVGWAVEFCNERYAELSSDLSAELENLKFGKSPDEQSLAFMWTANNDARSCVIFGDPAVRLPVANGVS